MTGGVNLTEGARKQLDAAIMQDYEALGGTLAPRLQAANAAYRKEAALEDLGGLINAQSTMRCKARGPGG